MNWQQAIVDHGGHESGINRLDDANDYRLLPFTSLLSSRGDEFHDGACLLAVYEWQEQPLVLLVDGGVVQDADQLLRLRRRAALHGDIPYLGVLSPGRLTIYAVALDDANADTVRLPLPDEPWLTLPTLAADRPRAARAGKQWIAELILGLLSDALDALIKGGINDDDAISLTGRALFTRFLADRGLIPEELHKSRGEEHLFDDPLHARQTCKWLDVTFNGDLLPLSEGVWQSLDASLCMTLGHVMRRAKGGQLHLGWNADWEYLDFAHIPVGVLSQAYEGYLRKHQPEKQDRQSSFFTPRPIADMLVDGAFHGLRREGRAASARVLDPAAGAGVFLISVYRQLVQESWREQNRRPDTEQLREILYGQLCGFDIDESALRFAALGLYLLAIELDPQPSPVQKLRFDYDLRGRVLFKLDGGDGLGSLGDQVDEDRHNGQYDLVIGNPPWSKVAVPKNWHSLIKRVEGYVTKRLGVEKPGPVIPDGAPDLGFVWRAGEWAKAGAQIAFALHARVLFTQGRGMPQARQTLMRYFDITGIVNGSALAGTKVWPNMNQQFCLLFARNRMATQTSAFQYFSPLIESGITTAGLLRLDSARSELIAPEQLSKYPWLFKTLFRGSRLDYEVLLKVATQNMPTLRDYWIERRGSDGKCLVRAGNGYQGLRKSTKKPYAADHLHGWPLLVANGPLPVLLPEPDVRFTEEMVHFVRRQEIYEGPLLLIPEASYAEKRRVCASVSPNDVVYTESYFGLSAKGLSDADELVRYLCLILRSRVAIWSVFMRSSKLGVERKTSERQVVLDMPIPPFENLSTEGRTQASQLFKMVAQDDSDANWQAVDSWVAGLYGLDDRDLQVIEDTWEFHAPYADTVTRAQRWPSAEQIAIFASTLTNIIQPWAEESGRRVTAHVPVCGTDSPWLWLQVDSNDGDGAEPSDAFLRDLPALTAMAAQAAASEIIIPATDAPMLRIGRLRQARYWTPSEARLLAERIVWEHADRLFG